MIGVCQKIGLLLNTDYNLASKIIKERLKKVMASIVHQGRTIFSNLHLVCDVLDFIDKIDEPAILVTLAFSRILINGALSSPVFLHRGVKQGCPLSPLLYVLVSEVLSTQIRNCKDIEGFLLPRAGGLQFKISQ